LQVGKKNGIGSFDIEHTLGVRGKALGGRRVGGLGGRMSCVNEEAEFMGGSGAGEGSRSGDGYGAGGPRRS
jgi:hypothetical protein